MSNLLGKLVQCWTTLLGADGDAVASNLISLVGERTYHPTGCHGWHDDNNSQELRNTQEELFSVGSGGDGASLYKEEDNRWRMCTRTLAMINLGKFKMDLLLTRLHQLFPHLGDKILPVSRVTPVFLL